MCVVNYYFSDIDKNDECVTMDMTDTEFGRQLILCAV